MGPEERDGVGFVGETVFVAPHMLKLGIMWKVMGSLHAPAALSSRIGEWVDLSVSERCGEHKYVSLCGESNRVLLKCQAGLLPLSQPAHAKSFYSDASADVTIPVT
jgi:hypothetical protein